MVSIGSSEKEERDPVKLILLNQRNTEAVETALENMNKKLHESLEVIQLQQTAIGSLMLRMDALELRLVLQKVEMTGLGPSVKTQG